jgi:hypothetical protein
MGSEKQIILVLNAVNSGCQMSHEIADLTGLSRAHCASYLAVLADDGLIRRTHTFALELTKGHPFHRYGPALPIQHGGQPLTDETGDAMPCCGFHLAKSPGPADLFPPRPRSPRTAGN